MNKLPEDLSRYQSQLEVFICDYQWAIYKRFSKFIRDDEESEIAIRLKSDLDFIANSNVKCPGLDSPIDFYL